MVTSHVLKPDFFIVGGPKCGTTAMADYLAQHPHVFMPPVKDTHFFGSDLQVIHTINQPADLFRVGLDRYLGWYAESGGASCRGEASVLYLFSKTAAAEIRKFNEAARIVIMLRHPVDMMVSLHNHCLYTMNETEPRFEAALALENRRIQGRDIPPSAHLVDALFYRAVARYSEQVQRYLDEFGRARVHVILFDDFRADTAKVYRELLGFLGVDPAFQADLTVVNPARRRRSPRLQSFIVSPPAFVRPLAMRMSRIRGLRKAVQFVLNTLNTSRQRKSEITEAFRSQLTEEFQPEIQQLSQLIDHDLNHW